MAKFRPLIVLCAAVAAAIFAVPREASALPESAETCSMCHAPGQGAPVPRLAGYDRSAHRDVDCAGCHQGAADMPHAEKLPQVDCASCHKNSANMPERVSRRHPVEKYLETVHGKAAANGNPKAARCADCHGSHDVRPGTDSASKVSRTRIAETCGRCHPQEATAYNRSVHGRARAEGIKESPACTDCHGEHDVYSPSSSESRVSSAAVTGTCSACHESERIVGKFGIATARVASFRDSYHGLAATRGKKEAANCASCHGWHEILPSKDPASPIHKDNLAQTCGACHPGAGNKFGGMSVHSGLSGGGMGSAPAKFFRLMYLVLIPLVIGGMFFHNFLDLARHSLSAPLPPLKKHDDVLLTGVERLQHALLALSFLILAYTGFALEYPDSWWSGLFDILGGEDTRRRIHRGAAALLTGVGGLHMGYLLLTRTGRKRLGQLLPALRDLKDPFEVVFFNLGLKKQRPLLERFSYIEKAEYWALVWGTFVMLATGAVLTFEDLSLAKLPLWAIETARVIHYMEAVLACLAIIVWHFYWVMLDPEAYPMNWAWLTGKMSWKPFSRGKKQGQHKDAGDGHD